MSIITYFHNDLDGRASAAIVYRKFGNVVKFIECSYKDTIDLSIIKPQDKVIIVDFSFRPEIMEKVYSVTSDVIWIDHHKTALDYKYSKIPKGIRDIKYSGCELTWKYYYPTEDMPTFIRLIGDMDMWRWKYNDTMAFTTGLLLYDQTPNSKLWLSLFREYENDENSYFSELTQQGYYCVKFRENFCKEYLEQYGFETKFEGYTCFALGLAEFGSLAFGDKIKKYDILISFEFDGTNWTVGLYSEKENIDVGKLAQKYGGGGHKGAAGFTVKELPFRKDSL
ncbi:MAG: DHH family phosphoesterase [archaeon]|nr:DHH family phosphoesterase [archaeon]